MGKLLNNSSLLALATLIGTIVGAGIFGLPYALSQSGVLLGLLYFILLGGIILLLHLLFGEFALRTEKNYRLPGYAFRYLGPKGKYAATFAILFSIAGALLAYTILGGDFLRIALSPFFQISELWAAFAFWAILSFFIFQGIHVIARAEMVMVAILFGTVGLITFFAIPNIDSANFSVFGEMEFFLPYGVLLFALAGWSAIPEIAALLKNKKDKARLDNIIVWASLSTIVLYAVFTFSVVGVSGQATSEDALSGLVPFLGGKIVMLGALFGLVAVAASFLVLGNYLKNSLRYDFGFPYLWAACIAVFTPLLLFLGGVRSFPLVMDIVGAISLGAIEGVLIVLIYKKAKRRGDRKPEYDLKIPLFVLVGLAVVLTGGAVIKGAHIAGLF
ncbi:MAG: aromatic amino acid transport family protein [Candidatus Yanofskybacteria bacterium]|nr:aromatic amino acid transport family protein [Candidatus Yanofskybacteria bacterium]